MRRGVELLREQNVLSFDGLIKIALAEAEARAGDVDRALAILDEALATCERTGHRAFEAELHRVRGEMLLKRDPANPAPAEEALLTAIAVAKQQGDAQLRTARCALARQALSIDRPAPPKPTPSSRRRSKAFRRRRKCPRSPRRRRCSRRWRRQARSRPRSAAPAAAASADGLRPGDDVVQGLRRRRNPSRIRARARTCGQERRPRGRGSPPIYGQCVGASFVVNFALARKARGFPGGSRGRGRDDGEPSRRGFWPWLASWPGDFAEAARSICERALELDVPARAESAVRFGGQATAMALLCRRW